MHSKLDLMRDNAATRTDRSAKFLHGVAATDSQPLTDLLHGRAANGWSCAALCANLAVGAISATAMHVHVLDRGVVRSD